MVGLELALLTLPAIFWIEVKYPDWHNCPARAPQDADWLARYLLRAGKQFQCYFTIEQWDTRRNGEIGGAWFYPQDKVESIDDLMGILRRDLPGFRVVRSTQNQRIIHLIDRRLLGTPGYILDRRTAMQYSGGLQHLVKAIGETYMGGALRTSGRCGFIGERYDCLTEAKVDFADAPVRDILVEAIPLDGYCRLLWLADTFWENGRIVTEVQYRGPEPPPMPAGGAIPQPAPEIIPVE